EPQTGSFDIEDRNLMARTAMARADVVAVVARPTLTGLHGLVDTMHGLGDHGVDGSRVLVVLNRAPRSPRARAELTRTLADLAHRDGRPPHAGTVFVVERRGLDLIHHDQARIPTTLADTVGRAVEQLLRRNEPRRPDPADAGGVPVLPGSLGAATAGDR
ncbi:MAG: hypothetical protein KF703_10060, partial [Actinobacteria bacterium]|nr:hypothetical protein [Actinomycetota bacterium]